MKNEKNNNSLKLLGISYDVKYIFTNKGILETSNYFQKGDSRFIEYNQQNLTIGLDMTKNHYRTFYNSNRISLVEYANSARKFLYNLVEILEPKGNTTIIKEWEQTYGNKLLLINESEGSLLIEQKIDNSWNGIKKILQEYTINPFNSDFYSGKNFSEIGGGIVKGVGKAATFAKDQVVGAGKYIYDQGKQIADKGFFTWAGEKVSSIWNSVRNAISKAYDCLTDNFFECLMENIRYAAFSAIGMGTMTALIFVAPIGTIVDVAVFGSLLIWDVYKKMSGKYNSGKYQWSWIDIIIDAVCCILPIAGKIFKSAAVGIKNVSELGLKAAVEGGVFAKTLKLLKGGLGKITSAIGQGIKFIGEKLGLEFLVKFGSKAETVVAKGIAEASSAEAKALSQGVKKGLSLTAPIKVIAKSTGKAILITTALCSALGLDGWTCQHSIENGEVSEEDLKNAQKETEDLVKSDKFKENLNDLSVDDAEAIGLI